MLYICHMNGSDQCGSVQKSYFYLQYLLFLMYSVVQDELTFEFPFLPNSSLNLLEFDQISDDTLESLTELFERLADDGLLPDDCDVQLAVCALHGYLSTLQNFVYSFDLKIILSQIWPSLSW